ncbi:MAG: hypothetical protein GYB67_03185 [Chloroflexi bacterium]|nr:hypothetical protein [Chloroflexota bacterium]
MRDQPVTPEVPSRSQPDAAFAPRAQANPAIPEAFREPIPPPNVLPPDQRPAGGPGCLMIGLFGGASVLLAVIIVALAGAAGWTAGQREANRYATATRSASISEQLTRIPADVANRNPELLRLRLEFLVTLTPGVAGVSGVVSTATALRMELQPPPSATPSLTARPAAATATPTVALIVPSTGLPSTGLPSTGLPATRLPAAAGFDLDALLAEAQAAITAGEWDEAVTTLDAIIGLDDTFQRETVRGLMSEALNTYALRLYQEGQPARANTLVDRAREFGPLDEGLAFEQYAATLYLNATAAFGADPNRAIRALNELIGLGEGRYYQEARQMLYDQYVAYGDAFVAEGRHCQAVPQYRNALGVLASGPANGKLSTAQTLCANATPTGVAPPPDAGPSDFAPLGQG